jgi:hypothetical protein
MTVVKSNSEAAIDEEFPDVPYWLNEPTDPEYNHIFPNISGNRSKPRPAR